MSEYTEEDRERLRQEISAKIKESLAKWEPFNIEKSREQEKEVDWEIEGIVNKQHEEIQDGKKITVIDDFELTGISIVPKKEEKRDSN